MIKIKDSKKFCDHIFIGRNFKKSNDKVLVLVCGLDLVKIDGVLNKIKEKKGITLNKEDIAVYGYIYDYEEQKKELTRLGDKNPFIYDPDRRAILQAELDAIFAYLYGLNTEDLRYILDPEDVCGIGCINETFSVLKKGEIRQYGEYRTKRLVLEAWHKFGFAKEQ
mgnify:CR=1 FL=1